MSEFVNVNEFGNRLASLQGASYAELAGAVHAHFAAELSHDEIVSDQHGFRYLRMEPVPADEARLYVSEIPADRPEEPLFRYQMFLQPSDGHDAGEAQILFGSVNGNGELTVRYSIHLNGEFDTDPEYQDDYGYSPALTLDEEPQEVGGYLREYEISREATLELIRRSIPVQSNLTSRKYD